MIPNISILSEEYPKNPVEAGPFFLVNFGKFKYNSVLDIYKKDHTYLDWLYKNNNNQKLKDSIKIIKSLKYNYYAKNIAPTLNLKISDIKFNMGKYKGYYLSKIFDEDKDYCIWIVSNSSEHESYFEEWFIAQKFLQELLFSKKEDKKDSPSEKISNTTKEPSEKISNTMKEPSEKISNTIKETSEKISNTIKETSEKISNTIKETLYYLKNGHKIEEISRIRNLEVCTIEGHVAKIIELNQLDINENDIDNYMIIKETIYEIFDGDMSKIKNIKDHLDNSGINVDYRSIKFTIALIRRNSF